MRSTSYCQILVKHEFSRQIFEKYKYQIMQKDRQTNQHDEANSLFFFFFFLQFPERAQKLISHLRA